MEHRRCPDLDDCGVLLDGSGARPTPGRVRDVILSVDAVCDLGRLAALEDEWRMLHDTDPHAHVFTSWPWMSGRLSALATPWWVLVARAATDGPLLGLLPLRSSASDRGPATQLGMAGSPLADYTGFVCDGRREEEVLDALAAHVQERMDWRRLEIDDARDPRLKRFLDAFRAPRFQPSSGSSRRRAPASS